MNIASRVKWRFGISAAARAGSTAASAFKLPEMVEQAPPSRSKDSDWFSTIGITERLWEYHEVGGKIKAHPTEFRVTEVDNDGKEMSVLRSDVSLEDVPGFEVGYSLSCAKEKLTAEIGSQKIQELEKFKSRENHLPEDTFVVSNRANGDPLLPYLTGLLYNFCPRSFVRLKKTENRTDIIISWDRRLNSLLEELDLEEATRLWRFVLLGHGEDTKSFVTLSRVGSTSTEDKLRVISRAYPALVASLEDGKDILVEFKKRDRILRKRRWEQPELGVLSFVLQKRNVELLSCLSKLEKMLSLRPGSFKFAGTKDRNGITSQRITVKGVYNIDDLKLAAAQLSLRIGNFEWTDREIRFGELSGNRFQIRVRGISREKQEVVENLLRKAETCGFINYFGPQRFGQVHGLPNYDVGKEILRRNYSGAINEFLRPHPGDDSDIVRAKTQYQKTGDIFLANLLLPRYAREKHVLNAMERAWNDSPRNLLPTQLQRMIDQAGIRALAPGLRSLFIQAYSSRLWNLQVSERLSRSIVVEEGDFVLEGLDKPAKERTVRRLQLSELKQWELHDLVLLLPGSLRPNQDPNHLEIYSDTMLRDGVHCRSFIQKDMDINQYAFPRHLIAKPKNLEYFIEDAHWNSEFDVKLDFFLSKSSYATVFLDQVFGGYRDCSLGVDDIL